jgi:hypothetical protein
MRPAGRLQGTALSSEAEFINADVRAMMTSALIDKTVAGSGA